MLTIRIMKLMAAWLVAMSLTAYAAESEPVHYWKGNQRVVVQLALDEVMVVGGDDETRQQAKNAGMKPLHNDQVVVKMRNGDRQGLMDTAKIWKLKAGVRAVRAVLYPAADQRDIISAQIVTDQIAVRFTPQQDRAALLVRYQLEIIDTPNYSPDTVICRVVSDDILAPLIISNQLYEKEQVVFAVPMLSRQLHRRGDPNDAKFTEQWHLKNTGQLGAGTASNDINVTSVWNFGAGTGLGSGVNIAIVDDGLETTHADLVANARTDIDIDINYDDLDPNPSVSNFSDVHGTVVGGIAAARGDNAIGVSGVAPRAGLVGVRLLSLGAIPAQEAQALNFRAADANPANGIHVSNNSWGPPDDGISLEVQDPLVSAALFNGVTNGRGGLGIIYLWAGGNGYSYEDVANYDSYANSRYVIAVAASRHDGTVASYSEYGTNILINAPGGDDGDFAMVATDRTGAPGYAASSGAYTSRTDNSAIGTSFSTPVVAGVSALLLEANPQLTWRDVRHIFVRTSTKTDISNLDWSMNSAGHDFNRNYGFGRVNAAAGVAAAQSWIGVPKEAIPLMAANAIVEAIPDNDTVGITQSVTIGGSPNFRAEYVELTVSATHPYRGNLQFILTAPNGTASNFSYRSNDNGADFSNWVFTSVVHWDEDPNGTWSLKVADRIINNTGTLTSWSLRIHGYEPHIAPTLTDVSPLRFGQGAGNTAITCTGTNFAQGATRAQWNGVDLTTTVLSTTQARAIVPAANFVSVGTATITVQTPGFNVGDTTYTSTGIVVTIEAPPTILSIAPSPATTPEDTPVDITVNANDTDTAASALIFTATSANQLVIANSNLVFSGTGFSRTLTATPLPDANGSVDVTVFVTDGVSVVSQIVTIDVTAVNDPPVALDGRFRLKRTDVTFRIPLETLAYDPDLPGTALTSFSMTTGGPITFTGGQYFFTPNPMMESIILPYSYTTSSQGQASNVGTVFITIMNDLNGTRPLIVSEPDDEVIQAGSAFDYYMRVDTRRYISPPILTSTLFGAPTGASISYIGVTGAIQTWRIQWTSLSTDTNRHLSFGVLIKDSFNPQGADVQWIVLRIAATGATN